MIILDEDKLVYLLKAMWCAVLLIWELCIVDELVKVRNDDDDNDKSKEPCTLIENIRNN